LRSKLSEQPLVIAAQVVCRVVSHPGGDCITAGTPASACLPQPSCRRAVRLWRPASLV
jgi:hypothetical protein